MARYRLNQRYWAERQNQIFADIEKEEETLVKRMNKKYREISADVTRQIESYFAKYGRDKVVEYADMFQSLDDTDRQLLFRDMDAFAAKYPEYADLMPIRESIYKLNRLQGLQTSVDLQLLEMGAIEHDEFNQHYTRQVNHVYGETSRMLTGGEVFNVVSPEIASIVAGRNWAKSGNYSDAIWSSKSNLMEAIHKDLSNGLIRGDSYQSITQNMKKRLVDQQTNNIMRLVRTEGTYIANETMARTATGQMQYEEYEYSAVDDSRTSKICRSLDGQRFKFEDREPGLNFPPMHPHCRSSFTIVIPNEWADWTAEEIDSLRHEPGWTDKEVDKILKKEGYSRPRGSIMGLQFFSRSNKDSILKKINSGLLNKEVFNRRLKDFDDKMNKGVETPIETVYNKKKESAYYHIIDGHEEDYFNSQGIRNILEVLKNPSEIYETKDRFGSVANSYFKFIDSREHLVVVREGRIATAFIPKKGYVNSQKERGRSIYET